MSLRFLGFLLTSVGVVIGALPTWVGQGRIDAFGERVRTAAETERRFVKNAAVPTLGTLLLIAFAVPSTGQSDEPLKAESGGHGVVHVLHDIALVLGVISGGLIALAIVLGLLFGLLWLLGWLLAKVPTGQRAFVTVAAVLTIVGAYLGFLVA